MSALAIHDHSSAPGSPLGAIAACYGLSVRRLARSNMMWANLFFGALPLLIIAIMFVGNSRSMMNMNIGRAHATYEGFLIFLHLHLLIFFVANLSGFSIMRQEIEQQTLHYLLLQPIARWQVILGKFLGYLTISASICIGSLWATYLALTLPVFGPGAVVSDLFEAGRATILIKESLVLTLGLLSFGAFAMIMGTLFKSGGYMILLMGWEFGVPYLPSSLKSWTITHYLQSLLPVRLAEQKKIFEVIGAPASTTMSLTVLILVPIVLMAIASAIFYFKECQYGEA